MRFWLLGDLLKPPLPQSKVQFSWVPASPRGFWAPRVLWARVSPVHPQPSWAREPTTGHPDIKKWGKDSPWSQPHYLYWNPVSSFACCISAFLANLFSLLSITARGPFWQGSFSASPVPGSAGAGGYSAPCAEPHSLLCWTLLNLCKASVRPILTILCSPSGLNLFHLALWSLPLI